MYRVWRLLHEIKQMSADNGQGIGLSPQLLRIVVTGLLRVGGIRRMIEFIQQNHGVLMDLLGLEGMGRKLNFALKA